MRHWMMVLAVLAAGLPAGCSSPRGEIPLEGTGTEPVDVRIATADSGRVYLYFSPDDFREKQDFVSMGVAESTRWLQRTYYQFVDLGRERVRVDRRPGYVEIGISGALSREKIDHIIAKTTDLKAKYGDLSPIKIICRLEAGAPLPPPTENLVAKAVEVEDQAPDVEEQEGGAPPDVPVVEVVDPEAGAEKAKAEDRERRKRRSWGDYDFPL